MTAPALVQRHRRHARPRFQKVRDAVSRRIPKPVNAALDWAESDPHAAAVVAVAGVVVVVGVPVAAVFSPIGLWLLAFLAGVVVGASAAGVWHRIATAEYRRTIEDLGKTAKGLAAQAVAPVVEDGPTQRMYGIRDLPGGGL